MNVVIVQISKSKCEKKHEKLRICNKSRSLFYCLITKKTKQFFVISRSQDLSQLNEKLRIQLAEKETTITTLTRVNQPTVSLVLTLKKHLKFYNLKSKPSKFLSKNLVIHRLV